MRYTVAAIARLLTRISGIRHPALIISQNQYANDKLKRGFFRFFFSETNNAISGSPASRLRALMCPVKRACAGVFFSCVWILSSGVDQVQAQSIGLTFECYSPVVNPAATGTINAYSFQDKYNGDLMSPWIDASVTYECSAGKNETGSIPYWEISFSGYKFVKSSGISRKGNVSVGGQQYSVYAESGNNVYAGLIFRVKKDNGTWQPIVGTSGTQNIDGLNYIKKITNSSSNQTYFYAEKTVPIQFAVVKYGNQYPPANATSSSLKKTYDMGKFGYNQAKTAHSFNASGSNAQSKVINWGSGKIEVSIKPVVQYVIYASCSTPTISVSNPITLVNVLTTELSSVGKVAKEKTFKLNFTNCRNLNSIKYSVATPSQTSSSELANGLLGQLGTAGGIKIQLRRKNGSQWAPVSLGTQEYTVTGGNSVSKSLDLAVRYYRTGALSPGTVKGQMIFKITYQ